MDEKELDLQNQINYYKENMEQVIRIKLLEEELSLILSNIDKEHNKRKADIIKKREENEIKIKMEIESKKRKKESIIFECLKKHLMLDTFWKSISLSCFNNILSGGHLIQDIINDDEERSVTLHYSITTTHSEHNVYRLTVYSEEGGWEEITKYRIYSVICSADGFRFQGKFDTQTKQFTLD
jgi:hypothetical protein